MRKSCTSIANLGHRSVRLRHGDCRAHWQPNPRQISYAFLALVVIRNRSAEKFVQIRYGDASIVELQ
ncbi:hypothethical protein [Ralstonia solanacearum PSI07]|nr:hypothethical protein [Ralstonia solanacearum PSI07]